MNHIFLTVFMILLTAGQSKGISSDELSQVLTQFYTSPLVNLLFIYDSLSNKPIKQLIDPIKQSKKGYFEIKAIDCNTDDPEVPQNFPYCQDEIRKQLPALLFSKPSLNKAQRIDESSIKQYQGQLDEKSLYRFAVPLMQLYSVELRNQRDLQKFKSNNKDVPYILYLTDKQKISSFYKALTANFRDTIAFAHTFSKNVLDQSLGVSQYPTFLLNGKQKIPTQTNLNKMIERLQAIQGDPTQIIIQEYQTSKLTELTDKNIEERIYKAEQYSIIHVAASDGTEHSEWAKVQKKFKSMFKLYEGEAIKDKLGVKSTPALVYFPKSLAKKNVQKTIFYSKTNFDEIYDEIDGMIDDFTVVLVDEVEMQKHISIHLMEQRLVTILFHEKERSLAYKIISNDDKLQEQIAFFRMKDPKPEVIQQFQLKKLPSLIMLMNDKDAEKTEQMEQDEKNGKVGMNLKIAQYQGQFNYEGLHTYFESFVSHPGANSDSNLSGSSEDSSEYSETVAKKVRELKNNKKFTKHCKQQNCYLLILNGSPQKKDLNQRYISILGTQGSKLVGQNFGYIDGVCHPEIVSQFDIMEDEFPALVYINSKFQKYSRMIGRLQSSHIKSFCSKIQSNKGAMYRGYDKLNFENKDCEAVHKKINQLDNQQTVLSEEEAAIIEELRQEDEKKRKQFEQSKEKVRKKKKGKRPKRDYEEQL